AGTEGVDAPDRGWWREPQKWMGGGGRTGGRGRLCRRRACLRWRRRLLRLFLLGGRRLRARRVGEVALSLGAPPDQTPAHWIEDVLRRHNGQPETTRRRPRKASLLRSFLRRAHRGRQLARTPRETLSLALDEALQRELGLVQ